MMEDGESVDVNDPTNHEDDNVLKRFIELYETLPELWNCASPYYINGTQRCKNYWKFTKNLSRMPRCLMSEGKSTR